MPGISTNWRDFQSWHTQSLKLKWQHPNWGADRHLSWHRCKHRWRCVFAMAQVDVGVLRAILNNEELPRRQPIVELHTWTYGYYPWYPKKWWALAIGDEVFKADSCWGVHEISWNCVLKVNDSECVEAWRIPIAKMMARLAERIMKTVGRVAVHRFKGRTSIRYNRISLKTGQIEASSSRIF